jgi:hypothetical protein
MSPLDASDTHEFCSQYSLDAGEPIRGTATRADIWMALEYTGPWGARAFPESDLSEAVKAHVTAFQEATANTRIQFIRRPHRYEPSPIHFFFTIANRVEPRLYGFEFDRYDDLLDLDLTALSAGDSSFDAHRRDDRLFFTCVNGLRDACCARFGRPVHEAVEGEAGGAAWQCTHIGGHRLGPNLLFLPHALSYGRGTPEAAGRLVRGYRAGEVVLEHLRGRTIYDRPVQAAEHFIREQTGDLRIDAYTLVDASQTGDERWTVRMEGAGGDVYRMDVEARPLPEQVFKTCNSDAPSVVDHFYPLGYEVETA